MCHYDCSACPFARCVGNGAQSRGCWDVLQPVSQKDVSRHSTCEMQWWYTVSCKRRYWVCPWVAAMTCNIRLSLLHLCFHLRFVLFLSNFCPFSRLCVGYCVAPCHINGWLLSLPLPLYSPGMVLLWASHKVSSPRDKRVSSRTPPEVVMLHCASEERGDANRVSPRACGRVCVHSTPSARGLHTS